MRAIEVGQISNKIAFLVFKNELITIHRTHFPFLENIIYSFESIDELMLAIINQILSTYQQPIQNQLEKMDLIEQQLFLKSGNKLSIENLYYEKSKARLTKKLLLITQNIIHEIKVDDHLKLNVQNIKDTLTDLLLKIEEVVEDSMSILNSYVSLTGQKNNDVMRLLTVFSAFFLPLTFVAGIYGMNFKNMPELQWEYGYFIILFLMLLLAFFIYMWFKRKKII